MCNFYTAVASFKLASITSRAVNLTFTVNLKLSTAAMIFERFFVNFFQLQLLLLLLLLLSRCIDFGAKHNWLSCVCARAACLEAIDSSVAANCLDAITHKHRRSVLQNLQQCTTKRRRRRSYSVVLLLSRNIRI